MGRSKEWTDGKMASRTGTSTFRLLPSNVSTFHYSVVPVFGPPFYYFAISPFRCVAWQRYFALFILFSDRSKSVQTSWPSWGQWAIPVCASLLTVGLPSGILVVMV